MQLPARWAAVVATLASALSTAPAAEPPVPLEAFSRLPEVSRVRLSPSGEHLAYLWKAVMDASPGARIAIGTEGHFVRNARDEAAQRGVEVRHLADVPHFAQAGCGCATMSRNDPPHLAGILDLLRRGEAPGINRVEAGDMIDETTMARDRLDAGERAELIGDARRALERMIAIVEG